MMVTGALLRTANWSALGADICPIDWRWFQIDDDVCLSSKCLNKGLLPGTTSLVVELRLNRLTIVIPRIFGFIGLVVGVDFLIC